MTRRTLDLTEPLYDYLCEASLREPPLLARLRAETGESPLAYMQCSPEQGQLMALLVETIGARLCLELGTFTGYSSLWIAGALPAEGHLICCDINEETSAVARRYWQDAGLADRIELRLAPAAEALAGLEREYAPGSFDFAFLDADKRDQDSYFEAAMRLVRRGGLILIDNVLWRGRVADPSQHNTTTRTIDRLNRKLRDDPRIAFSLVPISDGLAICRKR